MGWCLCLVWWDLRDGLVSLSCFVGSYGWVAVFALFGGILGMGCCLRLVWWDLRDGLVSLSCLVGS